MEGGRQKHEVTIKWEHPWEGWVKVNTDGASKGNPGQAGAGGLIRGDQGALLGMFAENCGIASSTKAELLAVLQGLAYAGNKGYKKIILEVDSKVVANILIGDLQPSSPYYHIIRRCQEMVRKKE